MSFVAIIIAAAVTIQSPPQQFDLVCEGEHRLGPLGEDEATYQVFPLNNRIRVSLPERRFCWNECPQLYDLVDVDDGFITFNGDEDDIAPQRVNRRTGVFTSDGLIGSTRSIDYATCRPEPFSGFPSRLF